MVLNAQFARPYIRTHANQRFDQPTEKIKMFCVCDMETLAIWFVQFSLLLTVHRKVKCQNWLHEYKIVMVIMRLCCVRSFTHAQISLVCMWYEWIIFALNLHSHSHSHFRSFVHSFIQHNNFLSMHTMFYINKSNQIFRLWILPKRKAKKQLNSLKCCTRKSNPLQIN